MKHLLKKLSFVGGGKSKPKPKPAVLNPPVVGELKLASSYSYAETLDLISDGPIEGLVNKNGLLLDSVNLTQGIYLDDTVIQVSTENINNAVIAYEVKQDLYYDEAVLPIKTIFNGIINNIIPVVDKKVQTKLSNYSAVNSFYSQAKGNAANPYSYRNLPAIQTGSFYISNGNIRMTNMPLRRWSGFSKKYLDLTLANSFAKTEITPIFNNLLSRLDAASTTTYEKTYITNIFNKNFGNSWNNTASRALLGKYWIENLTNIDNMTDMLIVLKAPTTNLSLDSNNKISIIDSEKNLKKCYFNFQTNLQEIQFSSRVKIKDFLIPEIDNDGYFTGKVSGCLLIVIKSDFNYWNSNDNANNTSSSTYISTDDIKDFAYVTKLSLLIKTQQSEVSNTVSPKYNYSNILAEFRNGKEFQDPFKFFNKVLIDKNYNSSLLGPFRANGEVQRIKEDANVLKNAFSVNIGNRFSIPSEEGSVDNARNSKINYSDWNYQDSNFDELSSPIKHIIYNNNVSNVFVSLQINNLSDTASQTIKDADPTNKKDLVAGASFPAILNIEIETGKILANGLETEKVSRVFQIVALIQSPTVIDIGNPDSQSFSNFEYSFIQDLSSTSKTDNLVFSYFKLPDALEDLNVKRYIKVTKLSTETNSTLIKKDVNLLKITEIIPVNLSYPFSAIIGTKIDSRSFSSIPTRTYDCKLKKVKIPSNYTPCLSDSTKKDKRYYANQSEFDTAKANGNIKIYNGDWDGLFNTELQWTDNPAWILYDLLTNSRYGLGQYIDSSKIDKWALYKIGKFCDAVDDNGDFVGVPDSIGGLEPRFSCNILFQEATKIFDSLNIIASLFRGAIYFDNSEIKFLDDRPKDPIALFTNSNVKDGFFNYTNYRRDEQFNSIEIVYIDRFENFLTKVEYVEDEEDIRKRGVFKKTINSMGVTSRAMARRIGQHLIFQTIKENQSISFVAGLESLLCKPGDLIIVEDDLKSLKSNFGRVLDVNKTLKSIRVNESFSATDYTGKITVYTPTGSKSNSDLEYLADLKRSRLTGFSLTGSFGATYLTGDYIFDSYYPGYSSGIAKTEAYLDEQYPLYTGTGSNFLYFSTGFTGWVFATGYPFIDNNTYSKYISQDTSINSIYQMSTGNLFAYSTASATRRNGAAINISGKIKNSGNLLDTTHGLLDSDIQLSTAPQITTFNISGIVAKDYGCEVFVHNSDINANLVQFVKPGSPYRFQRKLADDEVYKIISIKEENPNEYSIIANKFNKEKYKLIENYTSIEPLQNTYSYQYTQVIDNKTYSILPAPSIKTLATGLAGSQLKISGTWLQVNGATGYNVRLYYPDGNSLDQFTLTTGYSFDINSNVGSYSFSVNAMGINNNQNQYFDSEFASTGIFIVYENQLNRYDRPFLTSVSSN
jgi:hypothetical protein